METEVLSFASNFYSVHKTTIPESEDWWIDDFRIGQGGRLSTLWCVMFPVFHASIVCRCDADFWPPMSFTFVRTINAPGLVNGYKPFYYRHQRTYSQCWYVSELNNKLCADYSMRRRSITMNPDYVQALQTFPPLPNRCNLQIISW